MRLWSWDAGRSITCSPSVSARIESSSPVRYSSTTTSRPASPNLPANISWAAVAATVRVSQTMAPFPAASPEALTTRGSAWDPMYSRHGVLSLNVRLPAVGTPAANMTSFA
jgi:hypothetical protein